MNLRIMNVEASADGSSYSATPFSLGQADPILGAPLTIPLASDVSHVRIEYSTGSNAPGLQWLEPSQTAGKKRPFLSTQSQTIFARSWIPLQDSPQVRVTYNARVQVPPDLLAVIECSKQSSSAGRRGI